MDTTQAAVDMLVELLEGECDVEAYYSYSGRGMYGQECLGFVVDVTDWTFAVAVTNARGYATDDDVLDLIEEMITSEPSSDSMGLNAILYWPGIHVDREANLD